MKIEEKNPDSLDYSQYINRCSWQERQYLKCHILYVYIYSYEGIPVIPYKDGDLLTGKLQKL